MKFGGTSVGNAECIRRCAEIVGKSALARPVVVIVSAMSGVTNQLLHAARCASAGEEPAGERLAHFLRAIHGEAAGTLLADRRRRAEYLQEAAAKIDEARSLCRGTALLRELTPKALDAISSIGERLSARLMASVLCELGFAAGALDATELIVTNDAHGRAEPLMELTGERAKARLLPLLSKRVIPVVTGFIGAARDGSLTTLGRGGSDYSATILGAALEAEEIIIWTDVDGVMTADPRLVPQAQTLPQISFQEAAELAFFGAKVLHPKTLRPVSRQGIPVWIRNSFRPAVWEPKSAEMAFLRKIR
jgi:aspartate kinase